ncbi:uncharacterized protein BX664DRAFT_358005 [Halteromyces radiatus]|uniref:uncharacterized protein n=1 Tax=Halteromyces radiatus TaxID=101107 RepID=UPI00222116B9|nr:uncharacterized protein BX664DRAFT_358005 [Halteromyces radiatus]KAI8093572.1 hypothetical protein BX664DRAFT_358005 [Halteromyces radiatus]
MSEDNPGTSDKGEAAWYARRKEWTQHQVPLQSKSTQPLFTLTDDRKSYIYRSLIKEGRSFTHSIPLSIVTDVVVHGWKQDGTWPQDEYNPKVE